MIIWGFRNRGKIIETFTVDCPVCRGSRVWQRIVYKRWFTLFFIPLFPYLNVADISACSHCGTTLNSNVLAVVPTAEWAPPQLQS